MLYINFFYYIYIMEKNTEIKWDEYGNPIIYPELEEVKEKTEEKSVILTLLEKFTNIKR
jgi:hypothetical protein